VYLIADMASRIEVGKRLADHQLGQSEKLQSRMVDGRDDAVFVQRDNSLGGRIHDRPVSQGLFLFLTVGSGNGQGIFNGRNDGALVCPGST
jgi:hypothetical protein